MEDSKKGRASQSPKEKEEKTSREITGQELEQVTGGRITYQHRTPIKK